MGNGLSAVHTTEDLVEGRDELARILAGVKELPNDRREALSTEGPRRALEVRLHEAHAGNALRIAVDGNRFESASGE